MKNMQSKNGCVRVNEQNGARMYAADFDRRHSFSLPLDFISLIKDSIASRVSIIWIIFRVKKNVDENKKKTDRNAIYVIVQR